MNKQPEALRLAELLESPGYGYHTTPAQCAFELRRLHEANQVMLEALKDCLQWMESLRSSGDAGNWEWDNDGDYANGMAAIAKVEQA